MERGEDILDMGERIRQARLEAGLTQKQVCGEHMSRNMLSLIESGSAKPSLATLQHLSQALKKPVGYFFGEASQAAAERDQAEKAWTAYRNGQIREAARLLDQAPELENFTDVRMLKALVQLELSEYALEEKRFPYAKELLSQAEKELGNVKELKRRILLLQGRLDDQSAAGICSQLPSLEEELLLRAGAALEDEDGNRALQLLAAVEKPENPRCFLLRGRAYLCLQQFQDAADCFHQAEEAYPKETARYLEQCYRELEDFKKAYYYACRQK